MQEKIKFHLDENLNAAIADALRRDGIEVTTTPEVGLIGASDEVQIEFAISQYRVIVTHDDDFVAIHRSGVQHTGIVYCNQNLRSIGEIVRFLILIWEVLTPEDMRNQLEFI
jgi:predicted nuclease of predicted toxin-antitoxin system